MDLETSGFSSSRNHIIEIAAEILSNDSIVIEDGTYTSLVSPPTPIPPLISDLTGITQQMVSQARDIKTVMEEFFSFVEEKHKDHSEEFGHCN